MDKYKYDVIHAQLLSFISYCKESRNPFKFCQSDSFYDSNYPYNMKLFRNEISDDSSGDFLGEILDE